MRANGGNAGRPAPDEAAAPPKGWKAWRRGRWQACWREQGATEERRFWPAPATQGLRGRGYVEHRPARKDIVAL